MSHKIASWNLDFHDCYQQTPPDPGHFEDQGNTKYHLQWDLEDISQEARDVIDSRLHEYSKFSGLKPLSYKFSKLILDKKTLSASEYATVRCVFVTK